MTDTAPVTTTETAIGVLETSRRRRRNIDFLQLILVALAALVAVTVIVILLRQGDIQHSNHQILVNQAGQLADYRNQLADARAHLDKLTTDDRAQSQQLSDARALIVALEAQVTSEYNQLLAQGIRPAIIIGPSAVRPTTPTTTAAKPSVAAPKTPNATVTTVPPTTTTTVSTGCALRVGVTCLLPATTRRSP